ncbi:MAG: 16S rRNA (guanine(966)-N(2))-methyltransferase RsmD [Candidatus Kapaibacterium sp.]
MRIIAGTHRGRVLSAKVQEGVRPTLDATRESIFNMLEHRVEWDAATVCDMFAGTGALGIEALSRGAGHCTFVEKQRRVAKGIEENLSAMKLDGRATMVIGDAMEFATAYTGSFDVIFIDPPYALHTENRLLDVLATRGVLRSGGICIAEHDRFEVVRAPEGWMHVATKAYGDTVVNVFRNA